VRVIFTPYDERNGESWKRKKKTAELFISRREEREREGSQTAMPPSPKWAVGGEGGIGRKKRQFLERLFSYAKITRNVDSSYNPNISW